jgi:hypothetical protein
MTTNLGGEGFLGGVFGSFMHGELYKYYRVIEVKQRFGYEINSLGKHQCLLLLKKVVGFELCSIALIGDPMFTHFSRSPLA